MSTGTAIVERALEKIGAHSIVSPADPSSKILGFEQLGSMVEMWLTQGISIGITPLGVIGDELNEPPDSRNAIIDNLAIELAPAFDNGKVVVSPQLERNARIGYIRVRSAYQKIAIPDKTVSSTLPVGAGNDRDRRTFFRKGEALNG